MSGAILGTQQLGALGTITAQSISANSLIWWAVDFDSGADGWVVESYITQYVAPIPLPSPAPSPTPAPSPAPTPVSPTPPPAPLPPSSSAANPFDSLYASTFSLTSLSNDAIPTVAKPSAKATSLATPSYIDPIYNTRVYKVTDASDFSGATMVRHEYSRRQAFNADNTRFIAQTSNGFWVLYDANTFQRLTRTGTNGSLKGLAGDAEPIWHPTDPTKLWYTGTNGGLIWYEKNVESDVDTVLANFTGRLPWSGVTSVWTKAEGVSSADGRYFAFMATSYNSSTQTSVIYGLFTWDRVTDTIVGTLPASAFGGAFPDHISMSPSGTYAVPSWAYNRTLGTRAYTRDFSSWRMLHDMSEHTDLAFGPNGEDYYVVSDYDSGYIRAVDMATGATFNLMSLYPAVGSGYANHISGKAYDRKGWVLISTYADSTNYGSVSPDPVIRPMYRKLILVELKPGGRQLNVAHTRAAANYGGYFGEHQATISRDGSRIIWATNFNDGGAPSDYMIGLPSWVYTQATAPAPAPTASPTPTPAPSPSPTPSPSPAPTPQPSPATPSALTVTLMTQSKVDDYAATYTVSTNLPAQCKRTYAGGYPYAVLYDSLSSAVDHLTHTKTVNFGTVGSHTEYVICKSDSSTEEKEFSFVAN